MRIKFNWIFFIGALIEFHIICVACDKIDMADSKIIISKGNGVLEDITNKASPSASTSFCFFNESTWFGSFPGGAVL